MTIYHSCEGCSHMEDSRVHGQACFRPKHFKSGLTLKPTTSVGFPIDFETSVFELYEGRADGDTCGPERRHHTGRQKG